MATVRFNAKAIEDRIRKNLRAIVAQAAIKLQAELKDKLSQPGSGRFYARTERLRAIAGTHGRLSQEQVFDVLGKEDIRVGKRAAKGLSARHRNLRQLGVHQASAPGEPPAADTGHLRRSIAIDDTNLNSANPRVRVGTNLQYGAALEYGDPPKLLMRPWLRPTVRKMRGPIQAMFTPQALLRGVVNASITVKPL